jgi:hypothetical protein
MIDSSDSVGPSPNTVSGAATVCWLALVLGSDATITVASPSACGAQTAQRIHHRRASGVVFVFPTGIASSPTCNSSPVARATPQHHWEGMTARRGDRGTKELPTALDAKGAKGQ